MKRLLTICTVMLTAMLTMAADWNPLDYVMTNNITFRRPYRVVLSNDAPVQRVNLDLSLDSGATWYKRIAHGLPAPWGETTYTWSMRCTPDMWTEHARVGVRTLWSSTTNAIVLHEGDQSDADFCIPGVRILAPTNGGTVLQPSYTEITWHEAGAATVDIGISTNAGESYTKLYTVASTNATNSYFLPIMDYPTGRLDIVVSANPPTESAYSNIYATVQTVLSNQ